MRAEARERHWRLIAVLSWFWFNVKHDIDQSTEAGIDVLTTMPVYEMVMHPEASAYTEAYSRCPIAVSSRRHYLTDAANNVVARL